MSLYVCISEVNEKCAYKQNSVWRRVHVISVAVTSADLNLDYMVRPSGQSTCKDITEKGRQKHVGWRDHINKNKVKTVQSIFF